MAKFSVTILLLCIVIASFSQSGDRIIIAGSAMTETVCALGDCNKIVASDRTSLYPAEIQALPSIGNRTTKNLMNEIAIVPDTTNSNSQPILKTLNL
jgi:iron complex transport system substrate-binding protein